jgi:hypothetical protein
MIVSLGPLLITLIQLKKAFSLVFFSVPIELVFASLRFVLFVSIAVGFLSLLTAVVIVAAYAQSRDGQRERERSE